MLDNASDAIFLAEIEGTILETNKKGEQLLGYSKEELSGIHISRIHPKEVFEKINNAFQKMAIEESSFINDVSVLRKDGKLVPVDITGSLVEQDGKKILLGIFRDITERKRAEDELLDSIQRNAALLNANPDMFFVFSDDGRFIDAKAEHSDHFHVPPSEFLGKRIKDILPPDLAQQTIDHIAAAKQTGRLVQYNYTLGMNGEPRDFEARLVPCENGTFMAVVRDITERKKSEEKLKNTMESLRKAVGATIQVMASAVEVRDPYTAGHQIRSAGLARAIATDMRLSQEKIECIRVVASIHDIGKLSIPAEILSKPSKLSELEFSLIKEHAQKGYEILKDVESPWPLAEIVCQHHERMDGSGYPKNLKGNDILIEARILIVADVVEAMASHRPYRPSLGIDTALEEIEKNRGTLYDKAVADACLRLFREKGFKLEGT